MKEFQVSKHNIDVYFEELLKELDENGLLICTSQPASTGSWGMAKLWRMWMTPTAKFMNDAGAWMPLVFSKDGKPYGKRPFSPEDAHDLFTREHLGVDEKGERLSWAKSGDQRKATKSERFGALRKHEQWCFDRGIQLFKPRGSEYDKLTQEQEK